LPPRSPGKIRLDLGPAGSKPIKILELRGPIPNQKGIVHRNSRRWYPCAIGPTAPWDLPYIDRLGRFSGHTLIRWSTDPACIVGTTIATISSRLKGYAFKHNSPHVVRRNFRRILRVSAYYAMTKNNYFWDRILFFTRNLEKYEKLLHRLLLFFLAKSDVSTRFVYNHAVFQAQWLLFRSPVKGMRDKSAHTWRSPESDQAIERISGEHVSRYGCIYTILQRIVNL